MSSKAFFSHTGKSDHEHTPPHPTADSSITPSSGDEKVGDHIQVSVSSKTPTNSHNNNNNNNNNHHPFTDPLNVFHSALGIPPPKPPKPRRNWLGRKKPVPADPEKAQPKLSPQNVGVYQTVVNCEKWARFRYHFCNSVVSIAMFLQIVVGASVTAFGAGSASHVIVTVFGAANTALASLLAVLKSQGLPNRIRQDWNGWRELREYIEEREREIEMQISGKVEGKSIDVWQEIKVIEARYNAVRLTGEANRPDSYTKVPPLMVISK
ncbi:hypothetical protein B7463_g2181, partial [Scytalidium lignicola]